MMIEQEKKKPNASRYNMNEPNFLLLGDLQREAIHYLTVKKDYEASFDRWSAMTMIIGSMFEADEIKELDEIRKKLFEKRKVEVPENIDTTKGFGGLSEADKYIIKVKKIFQKFYLNKYVRKLNKLTRKYKISMTDLEKKPKLG